MKGRDLIIFICRACFRTTVLNSETLRDFGHNFETNSVPGATLFGRHWEFRGL